MKFKVNRQQPTLVNKGPPKILAGKSSGVATGGAASYHVMTKQATISNLRENSLKKDNWNLYVGDIQFKTNFLLMFKNSYTKSIYETYLLGTNIYSIRCLLVFMAFFDIFGFSLGQCSVNGCFLRILAVLVATAASIFGTLKHSHKMSLIVRKIVMSTLPIYMSSSSLFLHNQDNELLVLTLFFIPGFLLSQFIVADWIEYLIGATLGLCIQGFIFSMLSAGPDFILYQFMYNGIWILSVFVAAFTVFEKGKKENFVINYTNTKSRKIMLSLYNSSPFPICVVNKEGTIVFCNAQFEKMVFQRLHVRAIPPNIYKLTTDQESLGKIKQLVEDQTKMHNKMGMSQSNTEKMKKAQIKLNKATRKSATDLSKKEEQKEDHKSDDDEKNGTNGEDNKKNYFEKYEMAILTSETVTYKSQKAAMLTFNLISDQKAKNHLLLIHTQLLTKFMGQFSKRLEQLHQRCQDKERTDSLAEFLGTIYVAINQIQQIQHEFQDMSDVKKNSHESFLLREEVIYCLESLSVDCLSKSTVLNLKSADCLPEKMSGDLAKFRLTLKSVAEFAMKYCVNGTISIEVDFEGINASQQYNIAFCITFNKNPLINEEPLFVLLSDEMRKAGINIDTLLMKNYVDLFDYISEFGFGMVVFPSLVMHLNGTYSAKVVDNKVTKESEIKIQYMIPLSHAEYAKKVVAPFTGVNQTKQSTGSQYTFKSPLLIPKPLDHNKIKMQNDMKDLLSKSPVNGPRQFNRTAAMGANGVNPNNIIATNSALKGLVNAPNGGGPIPGQPAFGIVGPVGTGNSVIQVPSFEEIKPNSQNIVSQSPQKQQLSNNNTDVKPNENQSFGGGEGVGQSVGGGGPIGKNSVIGGGSIMAGNGNGMVQNKNGSETSLNIMQINSVSQQRPASTNQLMINNNLKNFEKVQGNTGSNLEFFSNKLMKEGSKKDSDSKLVENIFGKSNGGDNNSKSGNNGGSSFIPNQQQYNSKNMKQESNGSAANKGSQMDMYSFSSNQNNGNGASGSNANAGANGYQSNNQSRFKAMAGKPMSDAINEENKQNESSGNLASFKAVKDNKQMQSYAANSKGGLATFGIGMLAPSGMGVHQKQRDSKQNLTDGQENFDSEMMSEDDGLQDQQDGFNSNEFNAELNQANDGNSRNAQSHNSVNVGAQKRRLHHPLSRHFPKDILAPSVIGASKNLLTSGMPSPLASQVNIRSGNNSPDLQFNFNNREEVQPIQSNNIEARGSYFPDQQGQLSKIYQDNLRKEDLQKAKTPTVWDKNQSSHVGNNSPMNRSHGRGGFGFAGANASGSMQMPGGMRHGGGPGGGHTKASTIDASKHYVMIVEDNKFSLSWVTTLLSQMKVESIIAENGKEAVQMFNKYMKEGVLIDLILMDLIMPVMNGYEATQEIRRLEEEYKLNGVEKHFICGISAEVNADIEARCRLCGMNDILSKPLTKVSLDTLVTKNKRVSNVLGTAGNMIQGGPLYQGIDDDKDMTILPNYDYTPMQPQNRR